jgi:exopolysaccharide biosynthesis polyprenyl glycosylphosphotransferase
VLLNVLGDIIGISLGLLVAYLFRFHSFLPYDIVHKPDFHAYEKTLFLVTPVYLICFRVYGLYQTARHIRRIEEIFLATKAITLAIVILTAMTFFYRGFSYSRLVLMFLWAFSFLFIGAIRYLLIQFEYARKRRQKQLTRILVVGANRNARNIIRWARSNPHYGVVVTGVLSRQPSSIAQHFVGVPILGTVDQCEDFIQRGMADQIVLLDTDFSRERITDLVIACEDKMLDFKIGADFFGLLSRNVNVEYISTVPLLGFRALPLDDPWNRFMKRLFDLAVSFLIVFLTFPIWGLVSLLVKMEDGGPVFYAQERMGRDQKLFKVLKFRTMQVNAEKETGPVWAKQNDARRTRLGQFLRRWNIDELPQLFNVLRGDMTLVGPRPERPHFIEQFRGAIPRYMTRHKMKAGLTGWAQVNGFRGNTSIVERTKYDLYYMENWSLLFDIEILIMTFFAFKNAY